MYKLKRKRKTLLISSIILVVAVIVADELVVAFTFPIQVVSFVVTLPEIVPLVDHLTL